MSRSPRNTNIQALRALAALLVLIYHADLIPGGYVGVDIFYVISGFLITGLLLREIESRGSLDLVGFYARRFKRLLPSSFVVVIATGIAGWFLFPASMRHEFGKDLIAASTYISNILFAYWNNDYQNLNSTPSPFMHYWSLAVEEQFYLFWPILIATFYKIGKRRAVFTGISAIALGSFLFSLYLTEKAPIWSFYILPTRAWELALGALILFLPKTFAPKKFYPVLALAVIAYSSFRFNEATPFPGYAALYPVIATFLLIVTTGRWPAMMEKISAHRLTQWLGEVSYPLYLWHWPALVLPSIYLSRELHLYERVALLLATGVLAALTHSFIEEPTRYRNLSNRSVLTWVSVATAISVLFGSVIYFSYNNSITLSSGGRYSLEDIKRKPAIYDDGCNIHLGQTVSPPCEYGDVSSKKIVVLYGDSHAAQWMPALDKIGKARGFKLLSLTKSACPSAEVIKEVDGQYAIDDCQKFRDSVIARIAKEKPVAVIMSGMQPEFAPYSKKNGLQWWLKGEAIAFSRIKNHTNFPIYISDTPLPHHEIPECLQSGKGALCDDATPVNPKVAAGLIAINPTPWLCDGKCPAIVDGIVAYRDHSHISVDMSLHLATALESELSRIGVFGRNS